MKLNSEKILPKEKRSMRSLGEYGMNGLLHLFVQALDAAEAQCIALQEKVDMLTKSGLHLREVIKEWKDEDDSDADGRYNKALAFLGNNPHDTEIALKLAAYGE